MRVETTYKFRREEVNNHLHYRLIVESMGSSRWDTGTNKRRLAQQFTNEEIAEIQNIYRKCFKWYTHTGVPDEVSLSAETYQLWLKLKNYCVQNFTMYGGSI